MLLTAPGPIIGGFMAFRTTWRWMFWSTSIFQAVMVAMSFLCFRETYAPVILQRRAARLRKTTGDSRYQTVFERLETDHSLARRLSRALTRPLRLLAFHPIIQATSLMSALNYGLLYIVLSSLSEIWTTQYGQSVEISGLHYIAVAAGELIGSLVGGKLLDLLYPIMKARFRAPGGRARATTAAADDTDREQQHSPELRIPLGIPGILIASAGFFFYGWTAQRRAHWAVVDAGVLVASFGMQLSGLPDQAYVMDAYPEHTSSALAASQFLRSMTAFLFPLFAPQMYAALGYGWGNSLLGFLKLAIGLPTIWGLWRFGARLRAKAVDSY